jgi:serine/threonine protein kinase
MSSPASSAAVFQESPSGASYTPVVSSSGMAYRPFLELGEGGMAKVYLARATGPSGFNKLVVLKSMRLSDLEDDALRSMFVDEARLSARFNHPNLVQVQEVNVAAEPPYLVMEYLDGKPLSALRGNGRITLAMRLSIICEALTGLHQAHELCDFDGAPLGIVHRDISPQNVFITYDGSVKVLDFGIAKMVTNSSRTEAGEVKGKLAYMAPEQMLGAEIDRRADVFSVGSLLWESAVGRRMWDGIGDATLMHRLAVGQIPRPSEHAQPASLDPELEEIIVKATANDREERFQTALELQAELERYMARSGEHCSLRQIGAELADVFQDERRRNGELINRALRQSLPPPGAPAPTQTSETTGSATIAAELASPPSRAPIYVVVALVLLAALGFLAPRLMPQRSSPQPPVVSSQARTATPTVADGIGTTIAPPAHATDAPHATYAPHDSETSAAAARSMSSAKPRAVLPRRGVRTRDPTPVASDAETPRPTAPTVPTAPTAKPTDERCTPPYYFVSGIKTYKPECL